MTVSESTTEATKIIIDEISSAIAIAGAIICSILGLIANSLTLLVVIKRQNVRQHSTTPLLFFQAVTDFLFCLICLPFVAVRFALRENFENFVESNGLCKYSNSLQKQFLLTQQRW